MIDQISTDYGWSKEFNQTPLYIVNSLNKIISNYIFNYDELILDAGCGGGHLLNVLYEKQYNNIWGFDVSETGINVVKENKIVLLQGRLIPEEESALIAKTMEQINKSNFKGVEICTIYPESDSNIIDKLKSKLANFLLGNREGLTIIGPATIIKEIKKDPDKIQLFTTDIKKRSKKRK